MDRDQKLKGDVITGLKGSGLLNTVDINVDVQQGRVAMHGMVDVLSEKWLAGDIARKVPGVVEVDNSLTVVMDREVSDTQIFSSVQERLFRSLGVDLNHIEVGVNDGVVYLEGNVDNITEVNGILKAAAGVYGVKEVVNHIKVK